MKIAEEHGPYIANEYKSVWEPRLSAYYKPELLQKMLDTLSDMYMTGEIPEVLYNPGAVVLDDQSPVTKAFTALKESTTGVLGSAYKYLIIGGVIFIAVNAYIRRPKRKIS